MEEFREDGASERLSVEPSMGTTEDAWSVKREWLLSRLKKSEESVEEFSWVSKGGFSSSS